VTEGVFRILCQHHWLECCSSLFGKWLVNCDKARLDIFWLKDDSLEDSDNLPEPGVIAAEIVQDLESALEQFRLIAEDLGEEAIEP